jgi:hypothetical protein
MADSIHYSLFAVLMYYYYFATSELSPTPRSLGAES